MRSRPYGDFVQLSLVVGILFAARCAYAQQKAPVPDAGALAAAQKAASELFGTRFRSAKTAADKAAVAGEMIEAALKLQDGSTDQYVLLKIAREIASGVGDAATALQAAEEQAKRFDVPAARLKAETLLAAIRQAKATAQHKAVAEAALQLVGGWTDASEIELPLSVCEAGRSAAQKSRQFELVKELAAKADDLKKQRKAAQEYREALVVMDKDPAEPAANLTAGRYLCFVVGDWEQGVPYLALGSDAGLKAVALKELRGAASADEQAAIGDMWWDLAQAKRGAERDALLLRAAAWYRQAAPDLAGGLDDGRLEIGVWGVCPRRQHGCYQLRPQEGCRDRPIVANFHCAENRPDSAFLRPRGLRPCVTVRGVGARQHPARPCHGQERQYTFRGPLGHYLGPRCDGDTRSCGPESGPLGIHHGAWISD